jgi:peptidoglycan/xylan/chitin deacetylase (PgdA/CDA1 family)
MKIAMMKAAMSGLYHTRAHRLLAPYTQGLGVIFTLHHVRPARERPSAFAPNRILEITPEFLASVLDQVQEAGLDVVSIEEATQRLKNDDDRRFACFTFDDGYRDNFEYAYPLFKRRSLPLTLYVPSDYLDGSGELWWLALEQIVARASEIELCRNGTLWQLETATVPEKIRAFDEIYWWLRQLDEATQRRHRARARGPLRGGRRRAMSGSSDAVGRGQNAGLRPARHHRRAYQGSFRHFQALRGARLGRDGGRRRPDRAGARAKGSPFQLPLWRPGQRKPARPARQAGFQSAVTTRKGMLFRDHRRHLMALPRVSLNGEYQSTTYTALYLSGAPFALWNRFQQVNAA